MRSRTSLSITTALAATLLGLPALAQQRPELFGNGTLNSPDDLPPGQLRRDLERLPPQAGERALEWLNGFGFPESDLERIRVDETGGVYYVDETDGAFDPGAGVDETVGSAVPSGITPAETFALHSKPGAATTLFVDVDGHVITGTAWNGGGADPLYAAAFDSDGVPGTFSPAELDQIAEIWYRMAEDFAPFDVDVTTEEPSAFGASTGRVLITPNVDANGVPMPASGAGGVAYVNVFGRAEYGFYSPALVYSNNLGDFPPYIAEAASHEAGHNLGLSHDGTSTSGYYGGHGSGAVSWGPIMGTGYNDDVSQWSRGEYADANNPQDDIAIVADKLGLRADDHADLSSASTPLEIGAEGDVLASTPQSDPFDPEPYNTGVIGVGGDTDFFSLTVGAGPLELRVTPSWAAWPRSGGGRGTNLDIEATLRDASGTVVLRADPLDETDAVLATTLAAGDYYLGIRGVGNAISPYPDYGSQGRYFITGSVTPAGGEPPPPPPEDTTAPTPDPMSFAVAPRALGSDSIAMTATSASDDSGIAVEYRFTSASAAASPWQSDPSYTATGLLPGTVHSWQVAARDAAGNETAPSAPAEARTDPAPPTSEPPPAVIASVDDDGDGSATIDWNDVAGETRYEIYRESWHDKRRRWRSNTLVATLAADSTTHTDSSGAGLFRYRVHSVNAAGGTFGGWVEVTVTGGGGGGGGGCKGGPKKCG